MPGLAVWHICFVHRNQRPIHMCTCHQRCVCAIQTAWAIGLLVMLTYKPPPPPCPSGFEARGLIFGAPLALALGCAFVPLRKPGKLPGGQQWG
jgi:hypothetical protein